jgi:hypothetical protein
MADNLAYDLTGAWQLSFTAGTHSTTGDLSQTLSRHWAANFVRDTTIALPPDPPYGYRARFIGRFATELGEQVFPVDILTGMRDPTPISPSRLPLTVMHFYTADGGGSSGQPYYSTWSGALIWDWTDPAHPKDTKLFVGYYADLMKIWGRFEMKKVG